MDDVESIVVYRDEELLVIPSFNAERPQLFSGCISRQTDGFLYWERFG